MPAQANASGTDVIAASSSAVGSIVKAMALLYQKPYHLKPMEKRRCEATVPTLNQCNLQQIQFDYDKAFREVPVKPDTNKATRPRTNERPVLSPNGDREDADDEHVGHEVYVGPKVPVGPKVYVGLEAHVLRLGERRNKDT